MSYFTLDADNQNLINMREEKIADKNVIQPMRKRNHQGVNNPHYGHKQSEESKRRISETQTKRNDMIREFVKRGMQKPITEEKVRVICQEVLNEYLDRLTKPNNNRPTNINI